MKLVSLLLITALIAVVVCSQTDVPCFRACRGNMDKCLRTCRKTSVKLPVDVIEESDELPVAKDVLASKLDKIMKPSSDSMESFNARGTAYYPDNSPMEGGCNDRLGKPLQTLQGFLSGKHRYVSVAMDSKAFPYGTILKIPSINAKYGKDIVFCVVDTGGAFKNKGTSRMDICVANRQASYDPVINTSFNYQVLRRGNGRSCA